MKKLLVIISLLFSVSSFATGGYNIYPTNWWVGMKNPKLQLMIHRERVGMEKISLLPYPGVKMVKQSKAESNNYLFIDLLIDKTAKPGTLKFRIDNLQSPEAVAYKIFDYELKPRNKENGRTRVQGITSKDFLYLMIPDRFSNGDPSNDIIADYRDQTSDRKNMFSRHGGDFKGIENHFDYFSQLGVTALWLTPIIENNTTLMKEWGNSVAGYHGYWFTDHYQIDKRLGGNDGYLEFCNAAHKKGIKVVQDAIYNHISKEHFFATDPPTKDWINNWPAFTGPSHREETLFDPYGSAYDKKVMLDGWFTDHLPDLNQRNPFLATFLIQHAIWSTEYFGVDGWRVDTYKYCDEQFMNNVNAALEREFPNITIFGEAWVNTVIGNAYFTRNNINTAFKHNANSVIDFQTCFGMLSGMNLSQGWTDGVNKLYMTMTQDVVYKNPMRNCIFLDNHDMDRVFSVADEDWSKLKMGLNWLLTLRGIPQLYYGTEVLMKNKKTNTDATVREDFPGGWAEDKEKENRFTKEGRSDKQQEAFEYVSGLANFRKNSSAITAGKTMQFVPKEGLYVYFRYDAKQTVMIITNSGDKNIKPDWSMYSERTKGFTQVRNVVSGKIKSLNGLEIESKESFVFELLK
jgi:glycosidase